MNVKVKNGELVITLPLETPKPSASRKTLLVAGTHGRQPSSVKVNGSQVWVVANCFVYPEKNGSAADVESEPNRSGKRQAKKKA